MRKQRIYISGPITGNFYYKEEFAAAADTVREYGYKPVNPTKMFGWLQPIFNVFPYRLQVFIDCLVLSTCKGIFLMKGYEKSRGANLEKAVADFLFIPAIADPNKTTHDGPMDRVVQAFADFGKAVSKLGIDGLKDDSTASADSTSGK